ncbi:MAG: intermembrane phospholipid transport protein YdbH family protein, partial [Asticcacaulis sp.]
GGVYHGLALSAPKEALSFSGGEGALSAFSIAGSSAAGLKATLDAATLTDALPEDARRFNPLVMSGNLTQDARALTGRFVAATPGFKTAGKPTPVAAVTLDNDPRTQRGQLGLHTLDLTFTPDGLQPRDLSQMGTAFLSKDVSGKLSFDGAFRWDHDKTTSDGVLKLDGLDFTGAIGTAKKLQGEIDFTSLAPLESRPNQVLGIYRMEVGLPLSDLAMRLQFQGDRIAIEQASVQTPGGAVRLEPTSIAFDPKVPIHGAAAFDGLDFGKVVAATGLAQSMTFEGRLSGRVPFSILGGHISFAGGHM